MPTLLEAFVTFLMIMGGLVVIVAYPLLADIGRWFFGKKN